MPTSIAPVATLPAPMLAPPPPAPIRTLPPPAVFPAPAKHLDEPRPVPAPPAPPLTSPVVRTFPTTPLASPPALPPPPAPAPAPIVTAMLPVATPVLTTQESDVSLLKKIAGFATGAAKVGAGFAAGGPVGALAVGAKLVASNNLRTSAAPITRLPAVPTAAVRIPAPVAGAAGGIIGDAVRGGIQRLLPGGTNGASGGGCGCGSSDRDPCTRQKLSAQRAPEATFFGGCCPPGRVLRRRPWARDICAKKATMNVFNPRALARADRRLTGFVRRAAPILRDMGFNVETRRKPKAGLIKRKRRRVA